MVTTTDPPAPDALTTEDFAVIPTSAIRRASENRLLVDDEEFQALKASIADLGVLVPLIVRHVPPGDADAQADDALEYELIAGERRWTAAYQLEFATVPAIVLDYEEDGDRLAVMYSENAHRRDLSTMDKARHVGLLVDLGMPQRDIAERLGISQSQVSKLNALLKLPPNAQGWVDDGTLHQEEAVKIAGLPANVVKKLVPAGATEPPAPWKIDREYDSLKTQAAMVKGRELAKEKGFKVLKENDGPRGYIGPTTHDNGPVRFPKSQSDTYATVAHVDKKAHETEPCHAVIIEARGDKPVLVPVCTNPAAHPRPKGWKPKTAAGADAKPHRATGYAEQRKRKEAAVAAHLPAITELAKEALRAALKHEEDDYCLEFTAFATVEFDTPQYVREAADLLGLPEDAKHPHSTEPLVNSLLAPTPGTVDGFSVLYALALAAGVGQVQSEIEHLVEEGKRQAWSLTSQEHTVAFLNHLDGLVEGVPKYEAFVATVQGNGPAVETGTEAEDDVESSSELGTPLPHARCSVCTGNYAVRRSGTMREHRGLDGEVCGGSAKPPAAGLFDDAGETDADPVPTVTFSTKGTRITRTCSVHGRLGSSQDREKAHVMAQKHIDDEHGGKGALQDELVGVAS